jgi:uncharacterized membrane protein HdeD (DUF308 family)
MILQQEVDRIGPAYEELLRVRNRWKWFFGLVLALVIVSAFAISAAFLTTLTTIFVFGLMLLVGGAVQIVNSILAQNTEAAFLHLIVGVIHLIVGALMVEHPVRAAEGLTLLLAAAFLVGGLIRMGYALTSLRLLRRGKGTSPSLRENHLSIGACSRCSPTSAAAGRDCW